MSKGKSFRERVAALWSKKVDTPTTEEDLKKVGLTVMADKKFAERQHLLQILLFRLTEEIEGDTPQEQVEALKDLLNDVHIGIHMLAAPYYQTLDNINYHRLMRGWSSLHALATLCITTVEARIKGVEKKEQKNNGEQIEDAEQTPSTAIEKYLLFPLISQSRDTIIDIEALVRRLSSVLYLHVFKDAHLILLQSYSAEDVREKWAVVVNQPFMYGSRVPSKEAPEGYEMVSSRIQEIERKLRQKE